MPPRGEVGWILVPAGLCARPSLTSLLWRWKVFWKSLTVAEPGSMSWRSAVPQAMMLPGHHRVLVPRAPPTPAPSPAAAPTGHRHSRCR